MKKDLIKHQLTKQKDETLIKPYSVTFVGNDYGERATVTFQNESTMQLKEGAILTSLCSIDTKDQRVEIESSDGIIFRLGTNSIFNIENTIEGVVPVYYGKVYVEVRNQTQNQPTHKYYTSCWAESTTIFIDNVSDHEDCYYTLDFPAIIYEYDEKGKRFDIFSQPALSKTALTFDDSKLMRDRYTVKYQTKISQQEINYIISNFVNPNNWTN